MTYPGLELEWKSTRWACLPTTFLLRRGGGFSLSFMPCCLEGAGSWEENCIVMVRTADIWSLGHPQRIPAYLYNFCVEWSHVPEGFSSVHVNRGLPSLVP